MSAHIDWAIDLFGTFAGVYHPLPGGNGLCDTKWPAVVVVVLISPPEDMDRGMLGLKQAQAENTHGTCREA